MKKLMMIGMMGLMLAGSVKAEEPAKLSVRLSEYGYQAFSQEKCNTSTPEGKRCILKKYSNTTSLQEVRAELTGYLNDRTLQKIAEAIACKGARLIVNRALSDGHTILLIENGHPNLTLTAIPESNQRKDIIRLAKQLVEAENRESPCVERDASLDLFQ